MTNPIVSREPFRGRLVPPARCSSGENLALITAHYNTAAKVGAELHLRLFHDAYDFPGIVPRDVEMGHEPHLVGGGCP